MAHHRHHQPSTAHAVALLRTAQQTKLQHNIQYYARRQTRPNINSRPIDFYDNECALFCAWSVEISAMHPSNIECVVSMMMIREREHIILFACHSQQMCPLSGLCWPFFPLDSHTQSMSVGRAKCDTRGQYCRCTVTTVCGGGPTHRYGDGLCIHTHTKLTPR